MKFFSRKLFGSLEMYSFIKRLMELAGLSIREDVVGNIFGRWEGSEPDLSAVSTGSHIDAIPYSGKYDGVVGVLGAIEAINVLKSSEFKPKRSLEVIMFNSEEPTRYGITCLGSRLLAGSVPLSEALKHTVDNNNIPFLDAAKSAGISIGIVTVIAAPASIKVDFGGNGGHVGVVLMPQRNDAGLAAAKLALVVEKHVLESGSIDTDGTVGILEVHPGAINSIPSKSHIEIDTRDIDEKRRNKVIKKIHESAVNISMK